MRSAGIVQHGYGSPDVLESLEIEVPTIDDLGVLVEVHAASVNALDWHMTRGMPYLIRLVEGFRTPRHRVRGVDLAGRVVATGKDVTRFKAGDDVFGGSHGSFAEYAATTADRLASKPPGFTYEQAATLHVAGLTALASARKILPVIHQQYALSDAPEAIRQVGEGRARGKLTLAVR